MTAGILLTNILDSTCLLRFLFISLLQAPNSTPTPPPPPAEPQAQGTRIPLASPDDCRRCNFTPPPRPGYKIWLTPKTRP